MTCRLLCANVCYAYRVGLVESKIRLLVKGLEDSEGIVVAHVNPKQYEGNNQ